MCCKWAWRSFWADIGIAGGRGKGMLYKDGKLVRSFKEEELVEQLVGEIEKFAAGH